MKQHIYLASRRDDGGILHCVLEEDGRLTLRKRYEAKSPAWLCRDGQTLYALLREPFFMNSGIIRFSLREDGSLDRIGGLESTHGTIGAHIYAENGQVWCANYINGTLIAMPDKIRPFNGRGADPGRQSSSHPHHVCPTPDGAYLCLCDLGRDRIELLTRELEPVYSAEVPAGSGPRHLVFDAAGSYAYCSAELSSEVCVLSYGEGRLRFLHSVSTLPEGCGAENAASAIRLSEDGERLYVSNRGHDSIAVFAVRGAGLTLLGHIPAFGRSPRDFALAREYLLCANELSDNVQVFSLKDPVPQKPVCTFAVEMPWCVLPVIK